MNTFGDRDVAVLQKEIDEYSTYFQDLAAHSTVQAHQMAQQMAQQIAAGIVGARVQEAVQATVQAERARAAAHLQAALAERDRAALDVQAERDKAAAVEAAARQRMVTSIRRLHEQFPSWTHDEIARSSAATVEMVRDVLEGGSV
jgi:uncharacterized protein (DUF58 family)